MHIKFAVPGLVRQVWNSGKTLILYLTCLVCHVLQDKNFNLSILVFGNVAILDYRYYILNQQGIEEVKLLIL